jgi:hypothetical protein
MEEVLYVAYLLMKPFQCYLDARMTGESEEYKEIYGLQWRSPESGNKLLKDINTNFVMKIAIISATGRFLDVFKPKEVLKINPKWSK